ELNALDIPFDYAKPVSLIKYLMKVAGIVDDDIVLDFFSGSGTTGEATMQYNLENSVNCRYFLIQLPERTGERSAARNEGFQTIPEIAEERLIRAGNKLINENPESASKIDIGFKVFELEKSNLKKWNVEPENLNSQLDLLASNFEKDSKSIDIVYEIMLKQGLDLNYPINETTVGESVIYDIAFGAMFVVLGDTITSDVAGYIIKKIQDEKAENSVVVLQDEKFVNDSEKLNMIEQLNASGIQYNDILSV
ncbi:DNA methyltransferase, partial [Lactiplantibacillus plantarum]|uniref:DNA methyltransferase n=3 Tax=Lactobacillales TaxID=186826 RepID=UPI0034E53B97